MSSGGNRTKRVSFEKIRWLSIKEISEYWAPEINVSPVTIERELRLYGVNLSRLKLGKGLVEKFPDEIELPPADSRMAKDDLFVFCDKQGNWPLPKFWFGERAKERSYPGRPTQMGEILHKLEELAAKDQLEQSVSRQSEILAAWIKNEYPHKQTPTSRTIANNIATRWRQLRTERKVHEIKRQP